MLTPSTFRRLACPLLLAVAGLGLTARVRAQTTVYVGPQTYASGQTQTVISTAALETNSGTAVIVSAGANVTFSAGASIKLTPGFHAAAGSRFRAVVDTDGDGIPDVWEIDHNRNPNDPDDAALTDWAGHTYLLIYKLGTKIGWTWQSDPDGAATKLNVHRPQ